MNSVIDKLEKYAQANVIDSAHIDELKEKVEDLYKEAGVDNLTWIEPYLLELHKKAYNFAQELITEITKQAQNLPITEEQIRELIATVKKGSGNTSMLSILKNLPILMSIPVAGAIGVGAVQHFQAARKQKKQQEQIDNTWNIIKKRDELKDFQKPAKEVFETLAQFAPALAAHPVTAFTYVKELAKNYSGEVHPESIRAWVDIQSRIDDMSSKGSGFMRGFEKGFKGVGEGAKAGLDLHRLPDVSWS